MSDDLRLTSLLAGLAWYRTAKRRAGKWENSLRVQRKSEVSLLNSERLSIPHAIYGGLVGRLVNNKLEAM
jgi:hypothetical protein